MVSLLVIGMLLVRQLMGMLSMGVLRAVKLSMEILPIGMLLADAADGGIKMLQDSRSARQERDERPCFLPLACCVGDDC